MTSPKRASPRQISPERTSADRTKPVPKRTVGRADPPYCRLQSLPNPARPDLCRPGLCRPIVPRHATSTLQREQQREPKPPVLPSAALPRLALTDPIQPNRAQKTPDPAKTDQSSSGFQRTQRREPKPSALRSSAATKSYPNRLNIAGPNPAPPSHS